MTGLGPQGGDKHFKHEQMISSDTWVIAHNLGKYPSVTIVDSGNTQVIGDVQYVDVNNVVASFSSPFSGTAYLN